MFCFCLFLFSFPFGFPFFVFSCFCLFVCLFVCFFYRYCEIFKSKPMAGTQFAYRLEVPRLKFCLKMRKLKLARNWISYYSLFNIEKKIPLHYCLPLFLKCNLDFKSPIDIVDTFLRHKRLLWKVSYYIWNQEVRLAEDDC